MPTTSTLHTPIARQAIDGIDRAGQAAEDAVRQAHERVTPAAVRLASQAEDLAQRGLDVMRDGSQRLRERASDATDRGVRYVQEEPIKAVLIAAAAGAALTVIAQLFVGRRG